MRKSYRRLATTLMASLLTIAAVSQVTVTGNVRNSESKEPLQAVTVAVKGTENRVITDQNGNFSITVPQLPVILVITSAEFEAQELNVTSASEPLQVDFVVKYIPGQEVVISASRYSEGILESPVTIQKVSAAKIRNGAASNYYGLVNNLTGVDVVAASMTFVTPTTRGFVGSGNTRFTQIMDGMDNQAPGLNFSVGSIIGLTELDVESMELLQGASSALYGPGGMNGTLIITSKNPFKYQGLSFYAKTGIMHIGDDERDESPYYNWSLRWGHKISEKFAFKVSTELIQAQDWVAKDYRNYLRQGTSGFIVPGTRSTDPNYDGVNVYGDETTVDIRNVVFPSIAQAIPFFATYINNLPTTPMPVSRTGYTENEVTNPNTLNYKLAGALHYKLTPRIEAILAGYWGTGNTVYTGSQRYSLKNMKMGQYKLELNGGKWFVRGYTTQENAGESHNLTITTQLFNEAWKPSPTWYQQYAFAYLNALQAGRPNLEAHNIARQTADVGRPAPRSQDFQTLFDEVRKRPIPIGGLFLDRSDLWMVEGQYSFTEAIKVAELLVGGNWKKYVLVSEGTLFPDKPGESITIQELGAYVQVGKDIIKDRLKLTASGRYDKNENFKGRFTPRVTAVIKPAANHNIRLSFQTAYRFPSTQQQWIDLDVGTGRLLGAHKSLWEKYDLISDPPVNADNFSETVTYKEVNPESVTSFEGGYKALIAQKFLFDVYGYYGEYENFITRRDVVQLSTSEGYSVVVNSPEKVKTYGWGASFEWLLPASFSLSANVSSDKIRDVPAGFRAFFNSPELRTVVTVANTGFGPSNLVGFNVSWRWQEGFFYENDFIQGDLPSYHTVDGAITLKRPKIKSLFKLGATNMLNQYYRTAVGNPSIGGLYYISFAYNVL